MNKYFGNICISAVSAVAGGTIMHLTEKDIIENLKIEKDILKSENDQLKIDNTKYRKYYTKSQMFLEYYKKKYNENITIVNGEVIEENIKEKENIKKRDKVVIEYEVEEEIIQEKVNKIIEEEVNKVINEVEQQEKDDETNSFESLNSDDLIEKNTSDSEEEKELKLEMNL
jgi:hypothetical protein